MNEHRWPTEIDDRIIKMVEENTSLKDRIIQLEESLITSDAEILRLRWLVREMGG